MRESLFAITALVASFLCSVAGAATVTSVPGENTQTIISLRGEIVEGDTARVLNLVRAANGAGRRVSGVRLNSPGGSLSEGVKLADALRNGGIASVVANGATCASACFVAFAGGSEKFVSHSASVGVHGASVDGRQSGDGTIGMAKIVKQLGVPPALIGKMVVTPPSEIVWLTPDELRSMGATMTGKPDQAQARPSAPLTLQSPSVTKASVPSWSEYVDKVIEVSKSQNNGKARISRSCQPERKECLTALFYINTDRKETMVRIGEDIKGNVTSRDVCDFNAFSDVRSCFDWDTKKKTQEMKNAKGDWQIVSE